MAHGQTQAVFGLGRPATNVPVNQPGLLDEAEDNDVNAVLVDIDAVTGLDAGSVGSAEIDALAVATGDIAAAAVTKAKLAGGFSVVTVVDGTAAATDVTVTGMAVGDELVKVLALTTKASIATLADRTSEYTVQAGGLDKTAGTDETNNQLIVFWLDLT